MPTPVFIPVYTHVNSSDNGAKKIACEGYLKDYDAKTATVQQMQTYADCVKVLHPTDIGGMKIIVGVFLLGAISGAVIGFVSDEFSTDRFIGAVLGAISGLMVVLVAGLIGAAIMFIFS